MKMKTIVVTLLLMLAMVLTLSANRVVIETHAQSAVLLLQDFCDDYAPVTLEDEDAYTASSTLVSISDFAGNSYYYTTLSPQGYIIMHAATQKVVEASFDDTDPFENINSTGDCYYVGPGLYFREAVNEADEVICLSSDGYEYELDDADLVAASQQLNANIVAAQPVQNTTTPSSLTVTEGAYTYIKDYLFFDTLIEMCSRVDEPILPKNDRGTTGFNALAMVLTYFDVHKNSNIVSSEYMVNLAQSYYNNCEKDFNAITYNDIINVPFATQDFASLLVGYVNEGYVYDRNTLWGYNSSISKVHASFNSYIQDKIPSLQDNLVAQQGTVSSGDLFAGLNSGNPVVTRFILGYDQTDEELRFLKSMVVYGYADDVFLAVNPDTGARIVFKSYIGGFCLTLSYDGDHVHSETLRFKNRSCWGTYCPCGYKVCEHTVRMGNDSRRCKSCGICVGYHSWGDYISQGTDSHKKVCSACGAVETGSHRISGVGAIYTATSHTGQCLDCGVIFTGPHQLVYSPIFGMCCSCGYTSSGDGEIALGNPNHDENA